MQALQHLALVAINFIFVLLVVDHAGVPPEVRAGALSMAMLMCALGTALHAYPVGPVGSAYLLPVNGLFRRGMRRLSGYLAGKGADGARAHHWGGRQLTELRFEH